MSFDQPRAAIINGKTISNRVLEEVLVDVSRLAIDGALPGLAVVLVGHDPASHVYVRNKVKTATDLGIRSFEHKLLANASQEMLLGCIKELNENPRVNGILVQLPLPKHIDESLIINAIAPEKDVDGFHRQNVGGLVLGEQVMAPCTPKGCMRLLEETCGDIAGKHAVIIGRSNIVGKPMATLLLQAHCSVTLLHSRSVGAQEICRQADIVIAAVGRPEMINSSWIKPGAVVIDVGINRIEKDGNYRLVGDVDFESVSQVASAISPVPGGVGPMTIAYLMRNTVMAAQQQHKALKSKSVFSETLIPFK